MLNVYDLLGLQIIPPTATVKRGNSLSVICRIINHDQLDDFEMTWQIMTTGDNLANDPSAQVTQVNTTDLRLVVDSVTKPTGYSCVMQNSLRMIIAEHLIVKKYFSLLYFLGKFLVKIMIHTSASA